MKKKIFRIFFDGYYKIPAKNMEEAISEVKKVFDLYSPIKKIQTESSRRIGARYNTKLYPTNVSLLRRIMNDLKFSHNTLKDCKNAFLYISKKQKKIEKLMQTIQKNKKRANF